MGTGNWIARRARAVALVAVGAAGAGVAIAVASVPDSNGVIHACIPVQAGSTLPTTTGSNLRVIDPGAGQSCSTSAPGRPGGEESIAWNTAGPQGATGPKGPQGPEGHTLTLNGDTFTISGVNRIGTVSGTPLVAPLPVKTGGRPVGELSLDLGQGAPTTIDVLSWSFGAGQGSSSAGRGAGKPSGHEIQITKTIDKSSPLLFKACANGQHIKQGTLVVRKADKPYLTIKLSDVLVSSYQQGNGGGKPTESISLNFTKIEFKYSKQQP